MPMLPDNRSTRAATALEAVLPPRPTTPVIASDTLPCLQGKGSRNYSCPGCRRLLLAGIEYNQVRPHTVFRCPHCGSYSRMPLGR
jgi:DNA-directed RNA polymerase subunit RPC12/RpoP